MAHRRSSIRCRDAGGASSARLVLRSHCPSVSVARVCQTREGPSIATILFTWELGGGIGHLTRMAPIARGLLERGHRVVALVRDPVRAQRLLGSIPYRAAPEPARGIPEARGALRSFADILDHAGWGESATLEPLVDAWRTSIRDVAPDAIVMDHSPTALLASQGESARRVLLGTGFACPPDVEPLPDLHPEPDGSAEAGAMERRVREATNRCLVQMGERPLPRLASLFGRVDANLLATWAELDHYAERPGADYVGVWPGEWGEPAVWPEGDRPRVFAYLRPFAALPALLRLLEQAGLPSLVHLDGIEPATAQALASPRVRIVLGPVHLGRAANECRLAISNASHGTTAAMLLAGRPILAIPLHLEQFLVARRVVRAGAGQLASSDSPDQIAAGLRRLLSDARFGSAAVAFAQRHAEFDAEAAITRVVSRILRLAIPRPHA